jgi:hypothetical protein
MLLVLSRRELMKHTAVPWMVALASSLAFAQANPPEHSTHHPEGAASAPVAAPQAASPGPQPSTPDKFAEQMRMMQDMHKRIQAAKTPAERQGLMGEHMKLMQSGMEMLSRMGRDRGAMGMGAMPAAPSAGAPGDPPQQTGHGGMGAMGGMNGMMAMHGLMERRMGLMEQMMQMMVDREAAIPRREGR